MEPYDVTHFATPGAFRTWLRKHHAKRDELWVGYWKKGTGKKSVTWEETVDEALCYGWIDGIRKTIDEEAYTIRFTPRRPTSIWSNRNLERYAALDAEGRIATPGAEAYARKREDKSGVYSFEQKKALELSADFLQRLNADEKAGAYWAARPPGYKKRASHWVMSAKKEETRERRFAQLLEECAAGLDVKPLRRPDKKR